MDTKYVDKKLEEILSERVKIINSSTDFHALVFLSSLKQEAIGYKDMFEDMESSEDLIIILVLILLRSTVRQKVFIHG